MIKELFNLGCFKFGHFQLKSEKSSPFYINLRNIISEPKLLKELSHMIHKKFESEFNTDDCVLCGLPYAGIPYAAALSMLYDIPYLILRKEKKKYGLKTMIEGDKENKKVILIDDIITTGSSIRESLPYFKDNDIVSIITIIDRRGKAKNDSELNIKSLFTIEEVLETLLNEKLICRGKYNECIEFIEN